MNCTKLLMKVEEAVITKNSRLFKINQELTDCYNSKIKTDALDRHINRLQYNYLAVKNSYDVYIKNLKKEYYLKNK